MVNYSLSPESIRAFRKGMMRWGAVVGLAILAVCNVSLVAAGILAGFWPLAIAIPAEALILGIAGRRALNEQAGQLATLKLTLSPEGILRQGSNLPDVAIRRTEIARLEETPRGMTIRAADRNRFIFAPRGLVGYDELRACLLMWRPLDPPAPKRTVAVSRFALILLIVVGLSAVLAIFASQNPWLVLPAGVFLTALIVFTFASTLRNPATDCRTKRSLWLSLPIVSLIVWLKCAYVLVSVLRR